VNPPRPQKDPAPPTRSHDHELEITASQEEVWKAITEAERLVNWFPLRADVTPGAGGTITYRWGDLVGPCRIEVWDPPRHLRTSWLEFARDGVPPAGAPSPLLVDWHLEARGGRTVLRVVHSGFGQDARFDDEFESTRRGWGFELRSLRHWLERHRGRARQALWLARPTALPADAAWRRITAPDGLFREGDLADCRAGDRYRVVLTTGDAVEGVVWTNAAPVEFTATAENHGDGLFRFGFESCGGQPSAYLGLSTWRTTPAGFRAIEERWRAALERALA